MLHRYARPGWRLTLADEGVVGECEGEGGEACQVLVRGMRVGEVRGDDHGQRRDAAVEASWLGGRWEDALLTGLILSRGRLGCRLPEDESASLRAKARVRSAGIS